MDALVSSKQRELAVGFAAVALQIRALGAGEDVPIDVPQIVAGRVGAVLGELLAEAEVGGPVQSRDETVDHGLGDQVEVRGPASSAGSMKRVGVLGDTGNFSFVHNWRRRQCRRGAHQCAR